MKKLYDKITCALIGWDYEILKQCREASFRTKDKYASALVIVSIIWGIIGYKFASKYMGMDEGPWPYVVALMFIVIVICIERIIILKQGKQSTIYVFRGILALCMALLGSFIFDQILFSADLERQISQNKEMEIKRIIRLRMEECEKDIQYYATLRDSILRTNDSLNAEIAKNPVYDKVVINYRTVESGKDENGNTIFKKVPDVIHNVGENPLTAQVKANETELENNNNMMVRLQASKDSTQAFVTREIKARPIGFMEELQVSREVFFHDALSIFVYIILFIFMLGLELFVCSISWLEKNCDYDLVVEHQLHLKEIELKAAREKLTGQYLRKEMPGADNEQ